MKKIIKMLVMVLLVSVFGCTTVTAKPQNSGKVDITKIDPAAIVAYKRNLELRRIQNLREIRSLNVIQTRENKQMLGTIKGSSNSKKLEKKLALQAVLDVQILACRNELSRRKYAANQAKTAAKKAEKAAKIAANKAEKEAKIAAKKAEEKAEKEAREKAKKRAARKKAASKS